MSSSAIADLRSQRRMQSEEELLEYQRQFQQGAIESSTKVVRAVRKKPSDSGTSGIGSEVTAAAAPAAVEPSPAAVDTAATPAATIEDASGLVFPGGSTIAEHGRVSAPRTSFVQSSVSAGRTGFPAAFRADLSTRTNTAAAATGAQTTDTAQPAKKKSLFAQQRDRMLQKQREAAEAAGVASAPAPAAQTAVAPAPVREVVRISEQLHVSPPPAAAAPAPAAPSSGISTSSSSGFGAAPPSLPESRGINEENELRLAAMTPEEIEAEQREIEKMLPPALVAMLRARRGGQGGTGSQAQARPAAVPEREYPLPQQLDEDLLDAPPQSDDSDASDEEGLDENGARVSRVKERLEQDAKLDSYSARLEAAQQAHKLEWSAPLAPSGPIVWPTDVQGYQNDADAWNSFRVDLEGRFIGERSLRTRQTTTEEVVVVSTDQPNAAVVVDEADADDYDNPSNALYHHGDQADRPGYTMRELLHLARSTVMSQRTLSLQVISKVLVRIREDEYAYPAPVQPTPRGNRPAVEMLESEGSLPHFSHLLFSHMLYLNLATLLRLALDDNRNTAGILATLQAVQAIVFVKRINIDAVVDHQSTHRGYLLARRYQEAAPLVGELEPPKQKPTGNGAQEEEDESGARGEEGPRANDNGLDEELCARDMLVGLARMHLLDRMRFILEAYVLPAVLYRANPPEASRTKGKPVATPAVSVSDATASLVMLAPSLSTLLAFAQHSPQAAAKLFDTPRMRDVLAQIVGGLITAVATGRAESNSLPLSSLASSLHTALLLVTHLCQVHRDMAFFFLQERIPSSLKKFIVLANGVPGLELDHAPADEEELRMTLPLAAQTMHLWRVCIGYGLDVESFMDHFPVLTGIIARAPQRIQEATSGGALSDLWLRQLRAVCSVVEGLTLLFLPNATSPSTIAAAESFSAPPVALSFEFSHIVHAVDQVLAALPPIFFVDTAAVSADTHLALQSTLGAVLHLLATYYAVLPLQAQFDAALLTVQAEKHLGSIFTRAADAPLLRQALLTVRDADERGVQWLTDQDASYRATLPLTNLPLAVPDSAPRVLRQSLNTWFGIVRWQESLLQFESGSDPLWSMRKQRVLASTRDTRDALLAHFYAPRAHAGGANRLHARDVLLSSMESELVVSLLVLHRHDSLISGGSTVTPASLSGFYQSVLQTIPTLLRNGQQFLVSKLHADVLFNSSVLQSIERENVRACARCSMPRPASSTFTFAACKLLHDLYAAFAYIPEELLVSTLLHTNSILTPTLCVPVASAKNVLAHLDLSTGDRFCAPVPKTALGVGGATHTNGAWLLSMIKRGKFLQVQVEKKSSNTKLATIVTVLRYLRAVDEAFGVFTPQPTVEGAHPSVTLFCRAMMELYLLGSDVFLEADFSRLLTHFAHRLLDPPSAAIVAQRSARFVGVPNHAVSTLMFGASITAPGSATIRTQGTEMVKLVNPADAGTTDTAAIAASPLASMRPFYDFQSSSVPAAVWGTSFYPFFKDFVELFVADSMGDATFARFVVLCLRQEYTTDFRLVIWRECRELLQSLDVALPVDSVGFYFPYETNNEILQLLISHIGGAPAVLTRARNAALYEVALHHVAIFLFGWSHVTSRAELAPADRIKRVQDMMPMTLAPDVAKDLHAYRYDETKAVRA